MLSVGIRKKLIVSCFPSITSRKRLVAILDCTHVARDAGLLVKRLVTSGSVAVIDNSLKPSMLFSSVE